MGRVISLTVIICSVFVALNPNGGLWVYSHPTPAGQQNQDRISFAGLYKKLTDDVRKVFSSIKKFVDYVESDIRDQTNQVIKPLITDLLNQSTNDYEYLNEAINKIIDNFVMKINNTTDVLGDIQNGVNLTIINPGKLVMEIEEIIKDKEKNLASILMNLNFTSNPQLLNELLQAIYDYPQSKEYLGTLIKENLVSIIYGNYLILSNNLKCELKQTLGEIARSLENLETENSDSSNTSNSSDATDDETSNDYIGDFAVTESDNLLESAIDGLIDKIFDDVNNRNKKRLKDAIFIDRNVVISIGNTGTLF